MMNTYMISIKLPLQIDKKFLALIPEQRKCIDLLMRENIIIQYSLAIDRSMLWVVMHAKNELKAIEILSRFPLIDYMNPEITKLAFHNSIADYLPKLIMN